MHVAQALARARDLTAEVIDTLRAGRHAATHDSNYADSTSSAGRRLARAAQSRWAALPVVLAGTFMVVLDFFIVNVALPSMQRDLHAGAGAIEWVVAGYSLTSAVFLIGAARLGGQIGRRRAFSVGLALFTLASAACGVAGTPTVLLLAVAGLTRLLPAPERS